jgi:hypothetical protein
MTILEASNLIYDFFGKQDDVLLSRDFNKIILISPDKEKDKAILTLALESFEKMEIVESCPYQPKISSPIEKLWVLKRPITAYPQDIKLPYSFCKQMGDFINLYCEKFDFKGSMCDIKSIKEKDMENLLSIAIVLLNEISTKNKE